MTEVAVITGGASGFGLALAAGCAARGMDVALLDLDGGRAAAEAVALATDAGVQTLGLGVDVANSGSVDAAAAAVRERFERADLVISNVGVQLFASIDRATDDEWLWVLDVNVIGSARVARALLPLIRKAPQGRLAFTSSSSVLDPASRMAMYQSSKFAVWGLAETLRLELAPEGIGVSVIFPSGMISRHLETSEAAQPATLRRPIADDEDFLAMHESNPTMSEFLTTPEEAAEGVVDALLAGKRYVITHGQFTEAIATRAAELTSAAEAARHQGGDR
jgi:NAD(P)-dependent dehydrogenase (short-subunit alcohol dehydrogenase family)